MPVKTEVNIATVGYVILYVPDVGKSLSFYRDVLGLKVKVEDEGWAELATGSTVLALHAQDDLPADRGPGSPFVVFNVDDIRATYEALSARGVRFDKEPHQVCQGPDGKIGLAADFKDPSGNRLSIFGYEKNS